MDGFTFRVVGSTGCEILNPNGEVFAWTVNEVWAVMIVALLNREEKSERQRIKARTYYCIDGR
jgi:hypothetical protein